MVGQQIGSYRIERQLGEGGMGVVYVGVDVRLGRRAAIKQLLPAMSADRAIVERFFNEAKAAASINHPGIVEIYDVGWHSDGSAYFAMKMLEGDSLSKRLRERGPMPIAVAATIARQIASALGAAHARGIVHRDLKPDNVVLVADDEVAIGERATVLDFGIAKLFGEAPMSVKTRTGSVMGTPYYMSPEQCRGSGEIDHRTDVYALGCLLFEMLAGRPPFVAEGAGEILGLHQFVEAPVVRGFRADVPPELEAAVMRMLAKRPEQRPASMAEVTASLQPFTMPGARSMEQPAQRGPMASAPGHASMPSTLGASSGQVGGTTPPPPSRRGLWLGLGGAVVVAGVVAAVIASSGGGGSNGSSGGSGAASGSAPAGSAAAPTQLAATEPTASPIDAAEAAPAPVAVPVDAGAPAIVVDAAPPPVDARPVAKEAKPPRVRPDVAPPPQEPPPVDPATVDSQQLVNDASQAALNGQWARSLALSERAIAAGDLPAHVRAKAITVAALSACNLHNESKARKYYALAAGPTKTMLRQRCLLSHIDLGE